LDLDLSNFREELFEQLPKLLDLCRSTHPLRHITTVGAGQAGLQLGLGLLRYGYHVTVVSERTPEQIRHGISDHWVLFG
jgi:hypothetical protein